MEYLPTRPLIHLFTSSLLFACCCVFNRSILGASLAGAFKLRRWWRTWQRVKVLLQRIIGGGFRASLLDGGRRIFHHCYDLIFRENRVQFTTKLLSSFDSLNINNKSDAGEYSSRILFIYSSSRRRPRVSWESIEQHDLMSLRSINWSAAVAVGMTPKK